ncbi:MAG: helical backbone metal receptor [Candidatus Omnitrophica bacterium]|nr:helical backbone metal receptor [Candidatus Omnitrophota bacterium]
MKNIIRLIIFAAILILPSFPNTAPADDSFPRRIISLCPTLTEEIYLLGAEDRLVGVTTYCEKPPDALNKEKVGTIVDANLERIVDLEPDIVLTISLTKPAVIEKLKKLGIRTANFPYAESFSQICSEFRRLAALIGSERKAISVIQQAEERVATVKNRVSTLPRPKVFVEIGTKPLYTVPRNSFINDFIEFAGGVNVTADSTTGLYSREKVIADNPDVIIIATMGIEGKNEKEHWERMKTLAAARMNRIYIIDSRKLCSPTPVSFADTLEEIAGMLHPEKAVR